jgi:hypothetical protein
MGAEMIIERRKFLTGLVSALAAPAIVRIDSLMDLRGMRLVGSGLLSITGIDYLGRVTCEMIDAHAWSQTRWRVIERITGCNIQPDDISQANEGITYGGRLATPVAISPRTPWSRGTRPTGIAPPSIYRDYERHETVLDLDIHSAIPPRKFSATVAD